MKKILLVVITAGVILAGTAVWLFAAQRTVGMLSISRSVINANNATPALFTVEISDPTVISTSVNLLKVLATGQTPAVIGIMHDDGLRGDIAASDGIYSIAITLNEKAPAELRFRASAAFRGVIRRSVSADALLRVQAAPDPEDVLNHLISQLRSGNKQGVSELLAIADAELSAFMLLDQSGLDRLALSLERRTLRDPRPDLRIYASPWTDNVGTTDITFTLAMLPDGNWRIINW